MNLHATLAIYRCEMNRMRQTGFQNIASPIISTSLYFVVFGSALGSNMTPINGVSFGAFIVPGLIILTLITQCITDASFSIYVPRFSGTIYELLSAPVSVVEVLAGFIGAATTKSIIIGAIILVTARLYVSFEIAHPISMIGLLVLASVAFSLFGFILGLRADGFAQLQIVPQMIVSPLTVLGGTFYTIDMLPPFWRTVSLLNPLVYLVSGFRWAFFDVADVSVVASVGLTVGFLVTCICVIAWIFKAEHRLRP
jgi:ABC-2 type transport system permease protein